MALNVLCVKIEGSVAQPSLILVPSVFARLSTAHPHTCNNKTMPTMNMFRILIAVLASVLLCDAKKTRRLGRALPQEASPKKVQTITINRKLEQSNIPILLQVEGQPGLLNEYEYVILEETFLVTYNSLAQSLCPNDPPAVNAPVVDRVMIARDVSNYAPPGDGTVSRIYTLSSQITVASDVFLFSSLFQDDIIVRRQRRQLDDNKKHGRRLSRSSGKGGKGKTSAAAAAAVTAPTMAPVDGGGSMKASCPRLTEQAFTLAFREAIRAKSGELGTSVVDVTDVAEMKSVACNDPKADFTADLIVTFSGDSSLWTPSQEQALTQSFVQTYRSINSLNPDTCDLLFRDVYNVTLLREEEFNRRLDEKSSHEAQERRLGTTFSYLYRVVGTCRGCDTNGRIFGGGTGGRKLGSVQHALTFPHDDRHLEHDECLCPATASESRAATSDEFQSAYEATIDILKEENVVDGNFIQSIARVRQVRQVEGTCGAIETFETQVNVELSGTPNVQADEIEALERGFINTYKDVSGSFCDPLFRTPVEVTIDTMAGVGRLLQTTQQSSFTYQYTVKGQCRGCDGNSRLFGISVRRLLHSSLGAAGTHHDQRFLLEDLCFCSLDSLADRPMTQDEFAIAYNETVKELSLANIHHVVSVDEPQQAAATNDESSYENGNVTITWEVITTSLEGGKQKDNAPSETAAGVPEPTDKPACSPTKM